MEVTEGKCTNPECPANEVWVLTSNYACNTCSHEMTMQDAPPQKFASPAKEPDPTMIDAGD